MKLKNVVIFIVGFVGGIYFAIKNAAKWVAKHGALLSHVKKEFIDDVEHLFLGYNTIKTRPYTSYEKYGRYRERSHMTSYADLFNDSFEEDEKGNE